MRYRAIDDRELRFEVSGDGIQTPPANIGRIDGDLASELACVIASDAVRENGQTVLWPNGNIVFIARTQ